MWSAVSEKGRGGLFQFRWNQDFQSLWAVNSSPSFLLFLPCRVCIKATPLIWADQSEARRALDSTASQSSCAPVMGFTVGIILVTNIPGSGMEGWVAPGLLWSLIHLRDETLEKSDAGEWRTPDVILRLREKFPLPNQSFLNSFAYPLRAVRLSTKVWENTPRSRWSSLLLSLHVGRIKHLWMKCSGGEGPKIPAQSMKEMKSKQGVILRSQSCLSKQAIWGFYGVETGLTV